MHPLAAVGMSIVVSLGGVNITVSGSERNGPVQPKAPEVGQEAWLWPTNQVYPNMRIRMNNDTLWVVKKSVTNTAGAITLEIRMNPTTSRGINVVVNAADVATPIWWGADIFTPETVGEPGTPTWEPDPGESTGGPTPTPTPTPTQPPVEPPPGL